MDPGNPGNPGICHISCFLNFFLIFNFSFRIRLRMYRVTSSRAIITLSNIRILAYEISGATGACVTGGISLSRYAANHSISRILNLSSL